MFVIICSILISKQLILCGYYIVGKPVKLVGAENQMVKESISSL